MMNFGFFSPLRAVISLVTTVIVLAFAYFAIIKPTTKTVNQALTQSGVLKAPGISSSSSNSGAPAAISVRVQRLARCVTAAGDNTRKVKSCEKRFKP